jgi:SPP1 gp7 family putative phage head morphogenesis protein
MPVMKCTLNGRKGWKFGASGKCHTGAGAKSKAGKQGRAIKAIDFSGVRNDQKDSFVMNVTRRRTQTNGNKKTKVLKKNPVWLHPIPVENEYNRHLQAYVKLWEESATKILIPNIQSLIEQRNVEVPVGSRADDWADDADRLMQSMRDSGVSFQFDALLTAKDIGDKTNAWNNTQWRKIVRSIFGVDMFQREPWLNAELNSFTKENVKLISKMTQGMLDDIDTLVQRGLKSGSSFSRIAKDIEGRFDVTKNRAKLIARDQVSKLNGNLTQLRQTEAGVDSYIWVDSDDSRVRTSHGPHGGNAGKIFKWASPPSTGHPGSAVQCRCYADPVFDALMEEVTGAEVVSSPAIRATEKTAAAQPETVKFVEMSDAQKALLEETSSQFFKKGVDKETFDAFHSYTHNGFKGVNKYLRNQLPKNFSDDDKKLIANKISLMKDAYKKDYSVYKGTSWRGIGFESSEGYDKFIGNMKKGLKDGVLFPEFISSSQSRSKAFGIFTNDREVSVHLEIKSKRGMFIGDSFGTGRELEVLFKPDSKFKIIDWVPETASNPIHITLEEI